MVKKMFLGQTGRQVSRIGLGCMRIPSMKPNDIVALIDSAYDRGITFFDHADIYGGGQSEMAFSQALKLSKVERNSITIQSKCGIRSGFFDSSKSHIIKSVEGILTRLNTDYLDSLLIHRPDALVEPEEVAAAFDSLHKAGKVLHFGVSNHNTMQIRLLKKYLNQPLSINQMQMSLPQCPMIDQGLNVNMTNDLSIHHDDGLLDYCRLKDITIQPWSPFQYGFFEGVFLGCDKFLELNKELDLLAEKYDVTPTGVATAWLLRHPAQFQPIVGTTSLSRLSEICAANKLTLTREEWYKLYCSSGKKLP